MALSRVGGSSAAATSITIPAHVAGDLIVIWAYRDGSTTPPTVPTAGGTVPTFTTIDGPTGANACAAVCAWAIAAGTTDTSGTWTNATGMSVEVWRGAQAAPIGGHAQSGGSVASGGNIAIPAITLADATGNSAILAFAGHQNVTAWSAAPSGYTQQSQVATECEALSKNSTTTDGSFNVTCTASATGGTRTQQIEILADLGNRVSQVAVETAYTTTAAQARVSQVATEVLKDGVLAQARVSQVAVEALIKIPVVSARVSQVAVEVLRARADVRNLDFIGSHTVVYAPILIGNVELPFISSLTVVYAPTVGDAAPPEVDVPFIGSVTRVFGVFSLFGDLTGAGPGNGGELFTIRLAPVGGDIVATLAANLGVGTSLLTLTGDTGMPTDHPFVVTIDDEVLYVTPIGGGGGAYRVRARGVSNTTPSTHTAGADVAWGDSYDMAILSTGIIGQSFTADLLDQGDITYLGWLICFDSTQAYHGDDRYPMHVTEVVGVFEAGAGITGTNKIDASQPNAICTPTGVSDDCPAALSNPARMDDDILEGDVAIVRYTNPETDFVLDLGGRSAALQSWFGLKRVDDTDHDVTTTDPTGHVVDTDPGVGDFTGTVNGEWTPPVLGPGIAPDTGLPTIHDVPYTSVTLPGTDRFFTYGTPHYHENGWPMCCLAVRQEKRRVPLGRSWDWHNFNFVYDGFGTDCTYAVMLVNRNGVLYNSVAEVELPGPQDIDGPDAVWDDGSYYYGASWYVVVLGQPLLVYGPSIGGGGGGEITAPPPIPGVLFPVSPSVPSIVSPVGPIVEGGIWGDINPPGPSGLHVWQRSGGF